MPDTLRQQSSYPGNRAHGAGSARGERGAALAEATFVFPVLIVLIFGIVDFGFAFNDSVSLRQGTREGARQAVVATVPSPAYAYTNGSWASAASWSCPTAPIIGGKSTTLPPDPYDLICYTKHRIGLDPNAVRVSIAWTTIGGKFTPSIDPSTADSVLICTQTQLSSRTGLFGMFLSNKIVNAQTETRIEEPSATITSNGMTSPFQETGFSAWSPSCSNP
jgi:TadE-like protein